MKHTELALQRPVTTVVVFVALALVGLIASRLLPLEKFPDIEFPGIFVQIPYNGSTPEEVERLITRPVEESLATCQASSRCSRRRAKTRWRSSSSSTGISPWAQKGSKPAPKSTAFATSYPRTSAACSSSRARWATSRCSNSGISSDRDLSDSYDLLDRLLLRRLERIDGVSQVSLHGVDPRGDPHPAQAGPARRARRRHRDLSEMLVDSNFAVSAGRSPTAASASASGRGRVPHDRRDPGSDDQRRRPAPRATLPTSSCGRRNATTAAP